MDKQYTIRTNVSNILFLPEVVLLKILSYLCVKDLINLMSLHPRLAVICADKSLWKYVTFGPVPSTLRDLWKSIKYLGKYTVSLNIKGFVKDRINPKPKRSECISEAFFLSLKRNCPFLKKLTLEKCYIDAEQAKLSCLPSSLQSLSLIGSIFFNLPLIDDIYRYRFWDPPLFFQLEKVFPNLEEIDLRFCDKWLKKEDINHFESHRTLQVIKVTKPGIYSSKVIQHSKQRSRLFNHN